MLSLEIDLSDGQRLSLSLLKETSDRSLVGEEGQPIQVDINRVGNNLQRPDVLTRIRNVGGTGIHKQPAEHGVYIKRYAITVDPGFTLPPWESESSLGWSLPNGDIVGVRDAKFYGARHSDTGKSIEIIHEDTPHEPWDDTPWGPGGERPEANDNLLLPGGRMYSYRVCWAENPIHIEIDDYSHLTDEACEALAAEIGPWGYDDMPDRLKAWVDSAFDVGVRRDSEGRVVFSDQGKAASFVLNYTQGPARWASWNVDKEKDVLDMPDAYHKNPAFWPDFAWQDGHTNLQYDMGVMALREFLRYRKLRDGNRALWAWWVFSRFAQWSATSALCWTEPNRGGNNRFGWQFGSKSHRGSSTAYVGGMPGSFALTQQKLYGLNLTFAVQATNLGAAGTEAYEALSTAVRTTYGDGDREYGVREMFWIIHTKVGMFKKDPASMPMSEIEDTARNIIANRDPDLGFWPNWQYNPSGLTNVFEQAQCVLGLMSAVSVGANVDGILETIDDAVQVIIDRAVYEEGRWVLNIYQITPGGEPGFVRSGLTKANIIDQTEFTRPYVAAMLGVHALMDEKNTESRRLFLKMCETLGELMDWAPSLSLTIGSESHPLGRDIQDKIVTEMSVSQDAHPGHVPDWHAGRHFSAWWKILSSTFMWADIIGHARRVLLDRGPAK